MEHFAIAYIVYLKYFLEIPLMRRPPRGSAPNVFPEVWETFEEFRKRIRTLNERVNERIDKVDNHTSTLFGMNA